MSDQDNRKRIRQLLFSAGNFPRSAFNPEIVQRNNLIAAFSVRKVVESYDGPCLTIRRTSDNEESDFGFDANGDLALGLVTKFLAETTGTVVTWYDQGPQGKNATGTDGPSFRSNLGHHEAVDDISFSYKASLHSSGGTVGLEASFTYTAAEGISVFFVAQHTVESANNGSFYALAHSVTSHLVAGYLGSASGLHATVFVGSGSGFSDLSAGPTVIGRGAPHLVEAFFGGSTLPFDSRLFLNGALERSSFSSTMSGKASLRFGIFRNASGGQNFVGHAWELLVFNKRVDTDRMAIQENIARYYNIPPYGKTP